MWSGTGIVYNRVTAARRPARWADLWDPRLKGRLTMLDDPEDMLGACLKKMGLPFGATDPDEFRRAEQEAIRAEAAGARISECRGARSTGFRRCAGRAALVHHGAAGHGRRSQPRLRLSRRRIPLLLRLRRHSAREPSARSWRINFWITCCAPMCPRGVVRVHQDRHCEWRCPRLYCRRRPATAPRSILPPKSMNAENGRERCRLQPNACGTASGQKSSLRSRSPKLCGAHDSPPHGRALLGLSRVRNPANGPRDVIYNLGSNKTMLLDCMDSHHGWRYRTQLQRCHLGQSYGLWP